ncbi:MAG: hypothetical protein HC780_25295 [Leptolyngbyaceae cyanobacterium CSU_1_3]|nr:hypothetical protein [Leptolyngbyaceae cyanobacterium CSU_1_3]
MVTRMVRDLPGYANRVRTRLTQRTAIGSMGSILLAGRPEFAPLPLKPGSETPPQNDLDQAFLTTLERQTVAGQPFDLQQYHWLFLAKTGRGWQLALMYTRTGQPTTPPRESSQGIIGQAVRTWLRDCNAGAIRP